jgi:very-short-patch-repair endonuclease
LTEAFSSTSLSLKGRGTAAQRQGEGVRVRGRGKTPELLLQRSKELRINSTEAEQKLWSRLRAKRLQDLKFRRQVAFSENYIADFVCPSAKLIVELDGSQHAEQAAYDARRTQFFEQQGYRVLRFWNNDVFGNFDGVLQAIVNASKSPLPARGASCPSPLEGEGG